METEPKILGCTRISIPSGFVVLVSFKEKRTGIHGWSMHLDRFLDCSKVTFAMKGEHGIAIWPDSDELCGSIPSPPRVYNTTRLNVCFSNLGLDMLRERGFFIRFSFHKYEEAVQKLPSGLWNCSTLYWWAISFHFRCNLLWECASGLDESDCANWTTCDTRGVLIDGRCYTFINPNKEITHPKARLYCHKAGRTMASLNTYREWKVMMDVVQGIRAAVRFGLKIAWHNLPGMYKYTLQWDDSSICYLPIYEYDLFMTTFCGMYDPIVPTLNNELNFQQCNTPLSIYIACENKNYHTTLRQQRSSETVQFTTRTNFSSSIEFVHCPGRYVVHKFLACDSRTSCFEYSSPASQKSREQRQFWDVSSPQECLAGMSPLPPGFQCPGGNQQRVPYSFVCDFVPDCVGGSEETFCVFPPCLGRKPLQCALSKECLSSDGMCNGWRDCADGSDESSCGFEADIGQSIMLTRYSLPPPAVINFIGDGKFKAGSLNASLAKGDCFPYRETHFQCLAERYCLPVYVRCNNVRDCPEGEDEQDCSEYLCPGYYRCYGSKVCLHSSHVCDGWSQCPHRDDELYCQISCPESCVCHGLAFFCTKSFFVLDHSELRYLEAGGSGLSLEHVRFNTLLIHLGLSSCRLQHLQNVSLPNLHSLDLADNLLEAISFEHLRLFPLLLALCLKGNPLTSIFLDFASSPAHPLTILDLSRTDVKKLDSNVLQFFSNLDSMDLSDCGIHTIRGNGLRYLKNLRVIDFRGNPISIFPRVFLQNLSSLQFMYADNFKFCCPETLPQGFNLKNCNAPFDEVSSCEALLRSNMYRAFLSMCCVFCQLGNVFSFIMRVFVHTRTSGFQVFVTHLCSSDFLMGLYLAIVGVADRFYMGTYLWEETAWRHSTACAMAGFLSLLSSEASAFLVAIITLDRFLVLRFPFRELHFTARSARVTCALIWTISTSLAAVPLLPVTSHWEFYSQTGICIPLPVTRQNFPGHSYSFSLLIVLNFVLFLLIAGGQVFIFLSIRVNTMTATACTALTGTKSKEAKIARRLLSVAITDFLCWFPIGMLGLLASQGTLVPGEVSVALAIFVLPLNSALNPFLYTLNLYMERRRLRKEEQLLKRLTLLVQQQAVRSKAT